MKIVAIMPVRNEDWILGLSARALLRWVDELVILDHCSTDNSRMLEYALGEEYSGRVFVLNNDEPVWYEMAHRQLMLEWARARGATHIVTMDADEVLSANLVPFIREIIEVTPSLATLTLPWICLRDSIDEHHASGLWAEQSASMAFQDEPRCEWKQRNGYDFHHRHPMGRPNLPHSPVSRHNGGILHLQYSNRRRLLAKQALYKMTEVVRWPGRDTIDEINKRYNYSVYGAPSRPRGGVPQFDVASVPAEWWNGYEGLMQHLDLCRLPWQEAECHALIEKHGPSKFAGLDLFGVVQAEEEARPESPRI
jgi:glycosyltransferase involved in cell wall biosynthesis